MTQTQFLASVSSPDLARAVIRQCGGWSAFKEMASDVSNHGADGGFHGFIYYTDTLKFTARNRKAIRASLADMADQLGDTVIRMVANFRCLNGQFTQDEVGQAIYGRGASDEDAHTMIDNALAWYALEEVSRAYADNDA